MLKKIKRILNRWFFHNSKEITAKEWMDIHADDYPDYMFDPRPDWYKYIDQSLWYPDTFEPEDEDYRRQLLSHYEGGQI